MSRAEIPEFLIVNAVGGAEAFHINVETDAEPSNAPAMFSSEAGANEFMKNFDDRSQLHCLKYESSDLLELFSGLRKAQVRYVVIDTTGKGNATLFAVGEAIDALRNPLRNLSDDAECESVRPLVSLLRGTIQ